MRFDKCITHLHTIKSTFSITRVLSVLISTYSYININTIKTERWLSHLEKLSLCSSFVSVSPVNLPLGTTYLFFVLMVLPFVDIT